MPGTPGQAGERTGIAPGFRGVEQQADPLAHILEPGRSRRADGPAVPRRGGRTRGHGAGTTKSAHSGSDRRHRR